MGRMALALALAGSIAAAPAWAQGGAQGGAQGRAPGEVPAVGEMSVEEIIQQLTPAQRTRSLTGGMTSARPAAPVISSLPVQFGTNSATLSPQAKAQLDKLGKALQDDRLKSQRFRISGHTDTAGSDEHNRRLSARRAKSAADYLAQSARVERQRLDAIGMGEDELADPANPTSPTNRRVQVRTLP